MSEDGNQGAGSSKLKAQNWKQMGIPRFHLIFSIVCRKCADIPCWKWYIWPKTWPKGLHGSRIGKRPVSKWSIPYKIRSHERSLIIRPFWMFSEITGIRGTKFLKELAAFGFDVRVEQRNKSAGNRVHRKTRHSGHMNFSMTSPHGFNWHSQ